MIIKQNINMRKPLISVVTVVYNDRHHIEQTMQSVIGQSYGEIEYIVVDGHSTDGTTDVIDRYRDQISIYVSEPDKGIYDAMNKGIELAHGEWIIFMNSGDGFYKDTSIEDAFAKFVDSGEALVYGDSFVVNAEGEPDHYVKAIAETSPKLEVAPSKHQAVFTRASELKHYPFETQYKIIADFAFFYDLYKRNPKRYYSGSIVCYYDFTGVSSRSRVQIMKEKALLYWRRRDILNAIFYTCVWLKRELTH